MSVMKGKGRILLPVILCLVLLCASAGKAMHWEGSYDSGVSWSFDDGTLAFSGNGAIESVPADGVAPWFTCMNDVTKVVIGNGITAVGARVFQNHGSLTRIDIPESVKSIGAGAFSGCGKLTGVTIPGGVTRIEADTFNNCTSLASLSIPSGVTAIGDSALRNCDRLTGITVPAGVTAIGDYAFAYSEKIQEITFLGTTTAFGAHVTEGYTPTIRCSRGSDAEAWALGEGYSVLYSGEDPPAEVRITLEEDFRLAVGESKTISCQVYPDTDQEIVWNSSRPAVAAVDGQGTVKAISAGTAEITASVGEVTASVTVTVYDYVTGFDLSENEVWMVAGQTFTLAVRNLQPDENAYAVFRWISSNELWATVDENGLVKAVSAGDVTISARTDRGVERKCTVHVCSAVQAIRFSQDSYAVPEGGSLQLTAIAVTREKEYENKLITFSSSDPSLLQVEADGTVTGISGGKASVTASAFGNVSKTVDVTVVCRNHQTVQDQATAATCTQPGLTAGEHCERCGTVLTEQKVISALGHKPVQDAQEDATCLRAGLTGGEHCDRCGIVLSGREEIPALGHLKVTDEAVAPTCTEAGLTEGEHCGRCGTVFVPQEPVEALGHQRVTEEAGKAATCTEPGWTAREVCGRCGTVLAEKTQIEALGHQWVTEEDRAATCTEPGWIGKEYCERCLAVRRERETIEAPGHAWQEVVCTWTEDYAYATAERSCLRDAAHTERETVPTTAEVTRPATYEAMGETTYTARFENPAFGTRTVTAANIPMLERSWNAPVYEWAEDYSTVTASRTAADDETVQETETVGSTAEITRLPTCTEKGETTYTSARFVHPAFIVQTVTAANIPANGHTEVKDKAVLPTVSKTGKTEGKHCGVCGEVLQKQETVPRLTGTYTAKDGTEYRILKNKTLSYQKPGKNKASVSVPDTVNVNGEKVRVTAVSAKAFYRDKKLKTVTLGKYVTAIGNQAFASCQKLTAVRGGKAVNTVGKSAFDGCVKLKTLWSADAVTTIGQAAFRGDTALTAITLGKKVKSIGKQAFYGCKKLKTITIRTTLLTEKNVGNSAFKGIAAKAKVKCPAARLKAYKKLLLKKGVPKTATFVK